MGKHSSDKVSQSDPGYTGRHTKDAKADTVPIRVDTDGQGRVTGWAVGRDPGPDNYSR